MTKLWINSQNFKTTIKFSTHIITRDTNLSFFSSIQCVKRSYFLWLVVVSEKFLFSFSLFTADAEYESSPLFLYFGLNLGAVQHALYIRASMFSQEVDTSCCTDVCVQHNFDFQLSESASCRLKLAV